MLQFSNFCSVAHNGTIIFDTPIGNSDFIRSRCIDIAKSGDCLCSELVKLNDSQSSMLILRHCHAPRLNYPARQIFPVNLQAAANIHDNMTRSSFESIIGYNHLDDINWKQATLKIKFGGFGLTQISQISPAAFLCSWCQAMKDLPERFSSFFDLVNYLQSSKSLLG